MKLEQKLSTFKINLIRHTKVSYIWSPLVHPVSSYQDLDDPVVKRKARSRGF